MTALNGHEKKEGKQAKLICIKYSVWSSQENLFYGILTSYSKNYYTTLTYMYLLT